MHLVPIPWPWPSSGAVRCGAKTWPGPGRSTAARATMQHAVVALHAAEQHSWAARWGQFVKGDANKRHAWGRRLAVVAVVCCCLLLCGVCVVVVVLKPL